MKNNRYTFITSRCGETVPAYILADSSTQPLHSLIDPKREAQRLVAAAGNTDFIIFLGLGGGFAPEEALKITNSIVAVIDYDKEGITELLNGKDYSNLLNNERFYLLLDPSYEEIKNFILENFKPALCGGIKTIPLRTRIDHDTLRFEKAISAIQEAIDITSGDYSVQAHFGIRWFSNIIRNIITAEKTYGSFPAENIYAVQKIAIAAAGPSLDIQLPALADFRSQNGYIISSDTALGALLNNNIEPDVVVSIDCQFISYYHFMGSKIRNCIKRLPLVLDIASPPVLSGFSLTPFFFCGGHPLTRYLSAHWRNFPLLDTSGGNVTYACLSLAQMLGVKDIILFGADFSYVRSQTYARGTYIYPYFNNRQNRLAPAEALGSTFLYRSHFLPPQDGQKKNYYETSSLRFYRKNLEEKAAVMTADISCAQGLGAPINLQKNMQAKLAKEYPAWQAAPAKDEQTKNMSAYDFLEKYRDDISVLKIKNSAGLNNKDMEIFLTLLPYAAALKKREQKLDNDNLLEEVKRRSIRDIENVLNAQSNAASQQR